jgi:hypothetical protein
MSIKFIYKLFPRKINIRVDYNISAKTVYMTDLPPPYPGITGYSGYASAPNGAVGFAPGPGMGYPQAPGMGFPQGQAPAMGYPQAPGAMGFAPPPMMNSGMYRERFTKCFFIFFYFQCLLVHILSLPRLPDNPLRVLKRQWP